MANEEQRRAFASYMGTAGGNDRQGKGQPISQYPGVITSPGNPYLFNVSARVFSAPPESPLGHSSETDEVWPPPDVVRTHSYRKIGGNLPSNRSFSSRIIELSPSPPPRTSSTKVIYRSHSKERHLRSRNVSPFHVTTREDRRNQDAEARITAHPRPYRPVLPGQRSVIREPDELPDDNGTIRLPRDSPSRGILKSERIDRETRYRRSMSMRDSHESTCVEVGGPRVQFAPNRRDDRPSLYPNSRKVYSDEHRANGENCEHYHENPGHRCNDGPTLPQEALSEDMERLRIRRSSLPPRRIYEEDIQIDQISHDSPPPQPRPLSPRKYDEELHIRHNSPLPRRGDRPLLQPPPPSSERTCSGYRHCSRSRTIEHNQPLTTTYNHRREKDLDPDDVTDSDSVSSGKIIEVRTWRGIDENGQPSTFVEEVRAVKMIEHERERGSSEREFTPMTERLSSRSWRDV
ncbi:hypothetical protein BKA66DRAFT_611063 [Pyrenochaeta sp. MPI-SDFR-AT-0127]|nr:hypothetical protein BKA66DRAFT_611063 [Pyrenochaeta sp. MPI-SDFR-AT-0127]